MARLTYDGPYIIQALRIKHNNNNINSYTAYLVVYGIRDVVYYCYERRYCHSRASGRHVPPIIYTYIYEKNTNGAITTRVPKTTIKKKVKQRVIRITPRRLVTDDRGGGKYKTETREGRNACMICGETHSVQCCHFPLTSPPLPGPTSYGARYPVGVLPTPPGRNFVYY